MPGAMLTSGTPASREARAEAVSSPTVIGLTSLLLVITCAEQCPGPLRKLEESRPGLQSLK